jgi:GTP cyclohydrolase II
MPAKRNSSSDLDQLPDAAARADGVHRAIGCLRRGAAIAIGEGAARFVAAAVETLTQPTLDALRGTDAGVLMMAMTRPRAGALGLDDDAQSVVAFLRPSASLADIAAAAQPQTLRPHEMLVESDGRVADPAIAAALKLAKLAGLMPMLVVARDAAACAEAPQLDPRSVDHFAEDSARWLTQVADARVPLAEAEDARLIAFRPWGGGQEHLAIVIGTPDVTQPVLVRIHSACFTGDLIGSLRCDCGDQLRGAISAIAAQGAGVVVYLPQEGRGIGLVNKLRAYALQDAGFDTIDANTHLGFEPDERSYVAAGEILRRLGIARIRLLTNNPGKRAAMGGLGVEVVDRVPLVIAANPHNEAYLRTKKLRDGHNF